MDMCALLIGDTRNSMIVSLIIIIAKNEIYKSKNDQGKNTITTIIQQLTDNSTIDKTEAHHLTANDLVAPTACLEAINRLKWPSLFCVC